jgi:hypothetical protein
MTDNRQEAFTAALSCERANWLVLLGVIIAECGS